MSNPSDHSLNVTDKLDTDNTSDQSHHERTDKFQISDLVNESISHQESNEHFPTAEVSSLRPEPVPNLSGTFTCITPRVSTSTSTFEAAPLNYTDPPPLPHPPISRNIPINLTSELELFLVCPPSIGTKIVYHCGCCIDSRFLLLGHAHGIHAIDLAVPVDKRLKPQVLIVEERVRKLQVLEGCRVILALCGVNSHVRCYSLDALRRLCYYIFRLDWSKRGDGYNVPPIDAIKAARNKKMQSSESVLSKLRASAGGSKQAQGLLNETPNKDLENMRRSGPRLPRDPTILVASLSIQDGPLESQPPDIPAENLKEYYFKIPDSKEGTDFDIYTTSGYVYVAILLNNSISVWQRPKKQEILPFIKVKTFWIPEEPLHIALADDRVSLRHIIAVFPTAATVISLQDSKVTSVELDDSLQQSLKKIWLQQSSQSSSSASPNPSPSTSSLSLRRNGSNLSNLTFPPINWRSLKQLPFSADLLNPESIVDKFTVPPSYSAVVSEPWSTLAPQAIPSTSFPQLFFATIGNLSCIINIEGESFSRQVYRWTSLPIQTEFIQTPDKTYALGFSKDTVELLDFTNGHPIEGIGIGEPEPGIVMRSSSVTYLGRNDLHQELIPKSNRFRGIYWATSDGNGGVWVYGLRRKAQ